jgi:hypothetical protein
MKVYGLQSFTFLKVMENLQTNLIFFIAFNHICYASILAQTRGVVASK